MVSAVPDGTFPRYYRSYPALGSAQENFAPNRAGLLSYVPSGLVKAAKHARVLKFQRHARAPAVRRNGNGTGSPCGFSGAGTNCWICSSRLKPTATHGVALRARENGPTAKKHLRRIGASIWNEPGTGPRLYYSTACRSGCGTSTRKIQTANFPWLPKTRGRLGPVLAA